MLIGYVRVSTNDQNTALQRNALECAGCELIFEDKISGKTSDRPGLKRLLKTLGEGDTLVVWKLDRLGRSMRHLVVLVEELRERGINFRSLTDSIIIVALHNCDFGTEALNGINTGLAGFAVDIDLTGVIQLLTCPCKTTAVIAVCCGAEHHIPQSIMAFLAEQILIAEILVFLS